MLRKVVGFAIVLLFVMFVGWYMMPGAAAPSIEIEDVKVSPSDSNHGTILQVTTKYINRGCDQILLARFLMNTRPVPSIALPQQQGPVVLPPDQSVVIETIDVGFDLYPGTWHMFSVASCYVDKRALPSSTVSPTALFDIENGAHKEPRA